MEKKHRLKILVSAYACEPGRGSEPEVGWQWIRQLARKHDVWVMTRANNRIEIERSDISKKYPNVRFEYVDLPRWARFWKKGNRGVHVYYTLWQVLALFRGFKVYQREKIDLSHHLTFSPIYRTPLISWLPIPFMWGPIGAGEVLPFQYWSLFTFPQKVREVLRVLIRKSIVWSPFVYLATRKAGLIVAATHETRQSLPRHFQDKVVVEAQIGMNLETSEECGDSIKRDGVFSILTAGRHVYWKGHILIVRAFAKFLDRTCAAAELVVLSDGPEHNRLKEEANRLNISSHVKFLKWLPSREDVFRQYARADVFAYCSFFECGGYVVLEAMACGLPVVSIQLGGPGEIVTNESGILVQPSNIDQTVKGFADAFGELYRDDKLLLKKKRETIEVVKNNQWTIKGNRLHRLIEVSFLR